MVFGLFRRKKARRTVRKKSRRKVKRKKARRRKVRRKKVRRMKRKGKKKAFGGYRINPDAKLGAVIGNKPVTPAQMTKKIWQYIKRRKLGKK